ncbi:hypothetical protein [Pseudoalteromonas luteoviolacea]|uniref:Uncharacterized protein n=1 Tax=Pseudoalteromonas luteoviolacea S4054 TaxID=1129367 RepID=A0A0F6AEX8_9GAMM|nr:hypothetical protein [Pseudoalteromonas luteoviolacea]AOT08397.1 hypothetical protein S4054249_11310 [Pseudoalteromonas luteoviolacea]AOT13313.1 hypothetical protein S40542_11285 [Pseudoalteromonas luteoviolacea]AOT18226.1 hypothetical protein S4054_11285 [Pseudoalteromonas luteoviolacea]KKE84346.1 hypothetical protein N479_10635 [Pseudoalteromonas luteoviolacea S4054]KZN76049.1 hypothetical protein N481_06780 [Pseudoalteromonas luteoviolacea S4047-1]
MKKLTSIILAGLFGLSGCVVTQENPENLNKFSQTTKVAFLSYKKAANTHKAFAVARFSLRDYYGLGYAYSTIEGAEKRALKECHYHAHKVNKNIKCFIYHSE